MHQPLLTQNLLDELNKRVEVLKKILKDFGHSNYTFEQYEKIFSNYGWYIPFELMVKDITILVNQFENSDIEKADKFLIKHFKKNIKQIKNKIIDIFPERKNIINEAFSAHRKKMFFSSTILFISQADGITKNKIFMGNNFRNFSKENKEHPLVKLFVEKNPLTKHFNENNENSTNSDNLNRHGVMHGISNNYGIELNSFKALSFLWFVSNFRNNIYE